MQTTFHPGGRTITAPGFTRTDWAPQGGGGGGGDTGWSAAMSGPGQFANAMGGAYGAMAGGMGGIGKSFADSFGAYSAALANLGQQRLNEDSNRRSAQAMAEAARQGAVGNIGAASLGAYGSAANSAMAAWAANQQAYNNAVQNMHSADQQGMSQYGVGRNNALAALAAQYGNLGKAQIGANALANMDFNMTGSMPTGMTAMGPDGTIASGSYDPMTFSASGSRRTSGGVGGGEKALAGLDTLRGDIMSADVMDRMTGQAQSGAGRLDAQHASSRGMPSAMLGQTLSGLMQLQDPAYGESRRGMDQFYAAVQPGGRSFLDTLLGNINTGFGDTRRDITGAGNKISSGFGDVMGGMQGLFDRSLGMLPAFTSPLQAAQRKRAAEDFEAMNPPRRRYWHGGLMPSGGTTVQTNPRAARRKTA